MQEKHNEQTITGSIPKVKVDSQSHHLIKGKEEPISFTIDFNLESDYQISGCAHFEDVDRENEVIAINAIKKALPDFMQHPHLHYQHSERPIGTITEATIDGKGLYIKATIYDTKDTADAWEEIKTGKLNAYSIYGKRTISSPECKLAPEMRVSPCRTDGLHLWSISAVGKQAGTHEVNTHTFLDVVKGICINYYKNEDILIKADTTDSTLIHTVTDGATGGKQVEMEKAEETGDNSDVLKSDERNPSEIEKRLKGVEEALAKLVASDKEVHDNMKKGDEFEGEPPEPGDNGMGKATSEDTDGRREPMPVEKCSGTMKKSEEEEEEDEKEKEKKMEKAEEVEENVKKAELVDEVPATNVDIITKAQMDTFTKAFTDELTVLKARVEKMESETIQKGGTVVLISEDGTGRELSASERNANVFGL